MDEQKNIQRNEPGIDTNDQPAEGGPYIEDRTSEQRAHEQRKGAQSPDHIPVTGNAMPAATMDSVQEDYAPLFDGQTAEQFRTRWLAIQSKFVDDPGASVKQADELVADVIQNVTRNFADRRGTLEQQWNGGAQASTEDLRIALKQYRSFFDRLLTLES
jgi:hypothetical protein